MSIAIKYPTLNDLSNFAQASLKTLSPVVAPAAQFIIERMPVLTGENPLPSLCLSQDARKVLADTAIVVITAVATIGTVYGATKCIKMARNIALLTAGIAITAGVYYTVKSK